MPIDDPVSANKTLVDSEQSSQLVPHKEKAAFGLSAVFTVIAAASTGAEAIAAAAAASFFTVAGNIVVAAGQRRQQELVSYIHEEFHRSGVTKEQLEQILQSADEKVQEMLAEAVVRASEAKSTERVRRIARLLVAIILSTEGLLVEEAREMLEIAGSLFDLDAFVLGRMYTAQHVVVEKRQGHPELNEITASWRTLREQHREFREGTVNSACSRLQAHGLVMKIEPGTGQFDLQTYTYAITEFGIRFCTWCLRDLN